MLGLIAVIVVGLCLMFLFAIALGRCIRFGLGDDDEYGPPMLHQENATRDDLYPRLHLIDCSTIDPPRTHEEWRS